MSEDSVQKSEEDKKQSKKKSWLVPTVTTLIGVAVSLAIAWYQINLSNEQALQAENERAKSVMNELTLIVEEHVINQNTVDISRLARLSELRAKQEKLLFVPSVSEIIETAEYNILKSQYLDFEKKETYKEVFDSMYSKMYGSPLAEYNGIFGNSLNELYSSIQQGSTSESLEKLSKLATDVNAQLDEIKTITSMKSRNTFEELAKVIIDKPQFFIAVMTVYAFVLYLFMMIRRKRRMRESFMFDYHDDDFDITMQEELKRRFRESHNI
ncbi:hypothetical protein AB4584_21035 [Vibrio splendidus]